MPRRELPWPTPPNRETPPPGPSSSRLLVADDPMAAWAPIVNHDAVHPARTSHFLRTLDHAQTPARGQTTCAGREQQMRQTIGPVVRDSHCILAYRAHAPIHPECTHNSSRSADGINQRITLLIKSPTQHTARTEVPSAISFGTPLPNSGFDGRTRHLMTGSTAPAYLFIPLALASNLLAPTLVRTCGSRSHHSFAAATQPSSQPAAKALELQGDAA
jgi:hypothetical protein